jgi:hypothetical protein
LLNIVLKYKITLITTSLLLSSCQQSKIKIIQFKDIDWIITIPSTFKKVSKEKWDHVKNDGKQEIETALNKELTSQDAETTLMVYKSGPLHTIEANCKKHNSNLNERKYIIDLNLMTFETLAKAMPNTTLDSTSYIQVIDGKEFITQETKINYEHGNQLISKSYRRFIGEYIFSINTLHANSEKGNAILNSIISSKIK